MLGSRARGDASEDSDIDVLVVVDVSVEDEGLAADTVWASLAEAKRVEKSVYVPIAPLVLAKARFEDLLRTQRRLALDVEREGISL